MKLLLMTIRDLLAVHWHHETAPCFIFPSSEDPEQKDLHSPCQLGHSIFGPWWTWLGSEGVTMKVDRWIRTQGTFITHGMFGSFLNPDFSSRLEEWDGGDNVAHAVNWNFGRWKGFAGNSEDFSGFKKSDATVDGRREKNLIAFPDGRLGWGMEGWVRGMSTKLCTWCAFAYFSRDSVFAFLLRP